MSSVDINSICRTCARFSNKLCPVSTPFDLDMILRSMFEIQISIDDELPKNVCLDCAKRIMDAYMFKQICQTSDQALKATLCYGKSREPNQMYSVKVSVQESDMTDSADVQSKDPEINDKDCESSDYEMFSTDNNSLDEAIITVPDMSKQIIFEEPIEPHQMPLILRDSSISSIQDEEYQCDVFGFSLSEARFPKRPEFKCTWLVRENDLIRKTKENILDFLKKSGAAHADLSQKSIRLRKLSTDLIPQDVLIDDQVFGRYMELFTNKDNLVVEEIDDQTMPVTENDSVTLFVKHCLANTDLKGLQLKQVVIRKSNMNLTGLLSSISEISEEHIEFARGTFSDFPQSSDTLEALNWCSSLYELIKTTGEPSSGSLIYYRDAIKLKKA